MKTIIAEIIRLCLLLERMGENHYIELVTKATSHEEKELWSDLANDENGHISYWELLLDKAEHNALPELFENPYLIKHELETLVLKLNEVKQYYGDKKDKKNALFLSLHIEYYMLHDAFRVLLDYISAVTGDDSIKDYYDCHLNKILNAPNLLGINSLDIKLLTETIRRFWDENKALSIQTLTDPLTGVFNRRGFFKTLFSLLHLAKRENRSVGILMIDIDNFKYINDRYGHPTGDKVLQLFSATIKSNVRASDVIGRFGGEEFVVFLSNVDISYIFSLAERVRMTIAENTKHDIPITISIGVAHGLIEGEAENELHMLINNADRSLRSAKSGGKNRVMVSD